MGINSVTITRSTGLGQEAGLPVPQLVQGLGQPAGGGGPQFLPRGARTPECSRLTWKELRKRVKNTLT